MSLFCVRFWRSLMEWQVHFRSRQVKLSDRDGRPAAMDQDVYEHVHLLRIRGGL